MRLMVFAILQLLRKLLKASTDTHMKFLWRTYYKYKLGDQYAATVARAASLNRTTAEMTIGPMYSFFDMKGNRIRGWDNHTVKVKKVDSNPLMEKYAQR